MEEFLKLDGTKILKKDKEIRLRGVNFGNWLLIEHFMIGLPWVEYKMREQFRKILGEKKYEIFFKTYLDNYITEDDFKFLSSSNFNLIRLPINYRHFEDDDKPGVYKKEIFYYIDKVIELCKKYNIYLIIDLHAVTGCQAPDWNAESAYGEAFFWKNIQFQERVINLWKFIANYYSKESAIMGYEIINEPVLEDDEIDILNNFYLRTIEEIRKVDKNHIIILDSNLWATDIKSLKDELFKDPNVMPTFHHYHSHDFPFNIMKKYPGFYKGKFYGKEELVNCIKSKYYTERINRPHLAGEFGMHYDISNEPKYKMLNDIVQFFEEKKFPWTIWTYKDKGSMGFICPSDNTLWKKFLNNPEIKTIREKALKLRIKFGKKMKKTFKHLLSEEIIEKKFIREVMRDWHRLELDLILNKLKEYDEDSLYEMALSFNFKNCKINMEAYNILTKNIKEK
jgi:hypothetical protein